LYATDIAGASVSPTSPKRSGQTSISFVSKLLSGFASRAAILIIRRDT
jgi:hypothetical protein